jgi:hypothetical protein
MTDMFAIHERDLQKLKLKQSHPVCLVNHPVSSCPVPFFFSQMAISLMLDPHLENDCKFIIRSFAITAPGSTVKNFLLYIFWIGRLVDKANRFLKLIFLS